MVDSAMAQFPMPDLSGFDHLPFRGRAMSFGDDLGRVRLETLQVNVGKVCNLACRHCHVEAGPKRTEAMDGQTADTVLEVLEALPGAILDLTGGAPEMNSHFNWLVKGGKGLGREVIVRTNLTILLEEGYTHYPQWYADNGVHLIASLPCYTKENVDGQRGPGVFTASLKALRKLNGVGYGQEGSKLHLDLVYNPGGAFLPGNQLELEADYKQELAELDIQFSRLLVMTNLPIGRFRADLERQSGETRDEYLRLLYDNYNPTTLGALMCRRQVNVGWDGKLYDCDFNQMLELPLGALEQKRQPPKSIFELAELLSASDEPATALNGIPITVAGHCYGCTAGAGTSCSGALLTE